MNGKEKENSHEEPAPEPRKRGAAKPPEGSEHHLTIQRWVAYSEKRTGAKYPFGPRDAAAVKTLLHHFATADAVGDFIKRIHARTGFPFTGNTETLFDIANNLARLQGALTAPANGAAGGKYQPTAAEDAAAKAKYGF